MLLIVKAMFHSYSGFRSGLYRNHKFAIIFNKAFHQ